MKEWVVTMLVQAKTAAEAADAACELLNAGGEPDSITENVCAVCGQLPDYYLHSNPAYCAGCKAPHDHHDFKYQTLDKLSAA